ncbi:MAG TPA: biotin--[acetyl-CoA-carboxylase] ligase [Planctomycetota bacterium]|nr:biotin--[acetyl-CoA-carboxylase] ligase [Planctomycetota bacterium]
MRRVTLRLLMTLRRHGERGRAAWQLARELGIDRETVVEEIATLTEARFPVRRHRARRWSLGAGGPLVAEEIRHELGTHVFGRRVVVLDETTSTQDVAREEAARGGRSGMVVFAERQTRGRGRFGREWTSAVGKDLTFSTVLRADDHEFDPTMLTVTASVAVCETLVETLNLPARIKWPNDIILADRKVGGILVERTHRRGQPSAFVLGIGLNVNSKPTLEAATSLAEVSGDPVDRLRLARELLRSLDAWFEEVRRGHTELVGNHWRRYSSTLGTRVTVVRGAQRFTGRAVDISHRLGLTLELDDGLTMTFRGEHVTLQQ